MHTQYAYGRYLRMGQVLFFYISTIINKENNKLVLKNVCHFQSSGNSLNSLITASMLIWMSLSMCSRLKPVS